MTSPPSFSQLFTVALTKSLNNGYQDYYYLSEISEILGEYKLIEIKKGNPPKFNKKTYHVLSALNEIFSQWMQYLNLVTNSKDNKRIVNKELINSLISNGVNFNNIKKLPNYNNFINFFSFHYALNQYNHFENFFNDGGYIELEQNLNNALYGECGDPILNNFLNELKSRLAFNLNHYDLFSYIPNMTKENMSVLNKIDIPSEILRLVEHIKIEKSKTILEELDYDFQLTRQDAPYHLSSVRLNEAPVLVKSLQIPEMEEDTIEGRILKRIKQLSPTQFEHFSIEFIKNIIGSNNIKSIHNGQVGDGGIDGIVKIKKPLGSNYEEYYIQCKRYDKTSIGRPELQSFIGAMVGHNAKNGVFITTSYFTKQGIEYIESLPQHDIMLINGKQLIKDILDNKIGLKEIPQQPILDIDEEFFNQFPQK